MHPEERAWPAPDLPDRTRVVILVNRLGLGGAEVFAASCAVAMDRSRFNVSVCYFAGEDTLEAPLAMAGIPTLRLDERRRFDPSALWHLFQHLRRDRVDVLQTHLYYAGIVGRAVGRAARVPAIVSTEQNNLCNYPLRARILNDASLGLANAVVSISEGVQQSLLEEGALARLTGRPSLEVIHNGVDVQRLDERIVRARGAMRSSLGLTTQDFVIGTIGRLDEQKGQRTLIEALPLVRMHLPAARLVIVGKGDLREELQSLAIANGVANRVTLLGERSDAVEVMTAFDLFALPSNYEGLGVVLLEAMVAEKPIVATRIRGVTDVVVDGETGMLVPPADRVLLAEAILAIAGDPERGAAMAAAGRKRVCDVFDIQRIAERYQDLYLRLLAGHRRRA